MNIMIIIAFVLCGGTLAVDRLTHKLPGWLAVALYAAAAVLFVIGMIVGRNAMA